MLMSMLIVSHQDFFLVLAQIRGNTESRYYLNSINYNQEMGKMKKKINFRQPNMYVGMKWVDQLGAFNISLPLQER